MAEIENPRIAKFYKDGLAFIKTMKATKDTDPCFAIRPGMPQWDAWTSWFLDRCGRLPIMMRQVERKRLESFTVPAEEPGWFDRTWRPYVENQREIS